MFNRIKLGKSKGIFLATALFCGPVAAADTDGSSEWEYGAAVYMWGANITATTAEGNSSNIPFYKILDNLQFALMGAFEARKNEWSILTDIIYMDVKAKQNETVSGLAGGDVNIRGSVELKSWVVNAQARYAVHDNEKARIELLGGVRYLYVDTGLNLHLNDVPVVDPQQSGSNWDAIVGAHGEFRLNDKWFVPAYMDIGTGSSKLTWQAMAGIGYRFSKVNMLLTYRYLDYDFDKDSSLLGGMTMKGPMLGVTFKF